ncbi:hypothetical protein DV736_g1833, partial [Chaetothyriales sp. CBS 134916]
MAESQAVNDTVLNRLLVLVAIKFLKHWRPRRGCVLLLSKGWCVKYGQLVSLSEAASMRFIAEHTSVPVPRVICAFTRHGITYIVMERIDGEIIGKGWLNRSAESQSKILSQVKQMIKEIRAIPPPPGQGVANVDGGPVYDGRLPGPSQYFGPFRNIEEFHRKLRTGMDYNPGNDPKLNELVDLHGGSWPLVFTHGDLSSLNILARGDKVVGIVDWETAGWFPAYWEYTTACQVNPQNSFWRAEIDRFLDPYLKELLMESIRQQLFGNF